MPQPTPEPMPSWAKGGGVVRINGKHRWFGTPAPIAGVAIVLVANVFATFVLAMAAAIANNLGGRFHTGTGSFCDPTGQCLDDPVPHIDMDQWILGLYIGVGLALIAVALRIRTAVVTIALLEIVIAAVLLLDLGPDLLHQRHRLDQLRACHYDRDGTCTSGLITSPDDGN